MKVKPENKISQAKPEKITDKKLAAFKPSGNFLYRDGDNIYFAPRYSHTLFLSQKTENSSANSPQNLYLEIENYLLDMFEVYSATAEKPSFLFLNSYTSPEKILEILGSDYTDIDDPRDLNKLETTPSIYFSNDENEFLDILETLIRGRTDKFDTNNIFVIVDSPEENKINHLEKIITIARSRRIYFTVIIHDKEAFEQLYYPETLEIIQSNCRITFDCDENEILEMKLM